MATEIGVLLSQNEVAARMQVSKPTLWRLRKRADFPQPIYLRYWPKWDSNEIEAWLASRRRQN